MKVRRFLRRNLVWIVPAFLVVGTGLFFGLGNLVVWLWRVTLVDTILKTDLLKKPAWAFSARAPAAPAAVPAAPAAATA